MDSQDILAQGATRHILKSIDANMERMALSFERLIESIERIGSELSVTAMQIRERMGKFDG